MIVSTGSKVPTNHCFGRPTTMMTGDSALLLYFSESKTRSRNSTIVPVFQNKSIFMSVFYCVSQKYF